MMATPPDPDKESLQKLSQKLDTIKAENQEKEEDLPSGDGFALALEMVVPILVGLAVGYFIDQYTKTTPLFMLLFFILGVATAGFTIYKRATGKYTAHAWSPKNKDKSQS